MNKKNKPTTAASAVAPQSPSAQSSSTKGPCKLTPIAGASNAFQAKNSDMPISFSLSSPDGKTEFIGIKVYKAADLSNPLTGQPTAISAVSFTLNLPTGDYVAIIAVGALPSASPVWITEACSGATKLDWIVPSVTNGGTGQFALKVV